MLGIHKNIIKSTIPLLEEKGEELTQRMYNIMFDEYKEVKPLFNMTNQRNGSQPRALAKSILLYAKYIDNLEELSALISLVANKHASLQVLPEHYPIVGSCLLRAMRDTFGEDIVTDEVLEAWRLGYEQLANIFIHVEEDLYQHQELVKGGWRGARLFSVVEKTPESSQVISLYLKPVDGKAVINQQAGQYLGFDFTLAKEQRRNYSISQAANGESYRISVKREVGGVISNYLHDEMQEGDVLEIYPPFGNFTLKTNTNPLVLISAGIGITPLIAMLQEALKTKRTIYFIHAARNREIDPFKYWIKQQQQAHQNLHCFYFYEEDLKKGEDITKGTINQSTLNNCLPTTKDIDVYCLGPIGFMQLVKEALLQLGIPEEQTFFEFFGPADDLKKHNSIL